MIDQYGNQVPEDLVPLTENSIPLSQEEIEKILAAPWYTVEGTNFILVPNKELGELGELFDVDLRDIGLSILPSEVMRIYTQRWNPVDGFYWA